MKVKEAFGLGTTLSRLVGELDQLSIDDARAIITAMNGYILGRNYAERREATPPAPVPRRRRQRRGLFGDPGLPVPPAHVTGSE